MLIGSSFPTPERRVMTTPTVAVECQRGVVGIDRARQVGAMARFAFSRCAHKLPAVSRAVACIAVGDGMNARKRKTAVGVLVQQIGLRLPIPGNVTALTVAAQLAQMVVGMTIRTRGSHVAEYEFLVTRLARHTLMGAIEAKAGLVVVKRQAVREPVPRCGGMAIRTVPRKFAVWVLIGTYDNSARRYQHQSQHRYGDGGPHESAFPVSEPAA